MMMNTPFLLVAALATLAQAQSLVGVLRGVGSAEHSASAMSKLSSVTTVAPSAASNRFIQTTLESQKRLEAMRALRADAHPQLERGVVPMHPPKPLENFQGAGHMNKEIAAKLDKFSDSSKEVMAKLQQEKAFGAIYRAQQKKNARNLAVKVDAIHYLEGIQEQRRLLVAERQFLNKNGFVKFSDYSARQYLGRQRLSPKDLAMLEQEGGIGVIRGALNMKKFGVLAPTEKEIQVAEAYLSKMNKTPTDERTISRLGTIRAYQQFKAQNGPSAFQKMTGKVTGAFKKTK